jgi:hypothetical protein
MRVYRLAVTRIRMIYRITIEYGKMRIIKGNN